MFLKSSREKERKIVINGVKMRRKGIYIHIERGKKERTKERR